MFNFFSSWRGSYEIGCELQQRIPCEWIALQRLEKKNQLRTQSDFINSEVLFPICEPLKWLFAFFKLMKRFSNSSKAFNKISIMGTKVPDILSFWSLPILYWVCLVGIHAHSGGPCDQNILLSFITIIFLCTSLQSHFTYSGKNSRWHKCSLNIGPICIVIHSSTHTQGRPSM